jgi:hypothetical protein
VRIELRREHRGPTVDQTVDGAPLRGAVHERRDDDREAGIGRCIGGALGELPFVEHPHAGVEADETTEHAQDVFLAPHDTLGHAGGAAGVEDVDVVVGTFAEVALRARGGERFVVVDRADRGGVDARAVVDRDEMAQHRERLAHGGDARGVLRVVHERDEVGVVEEVPKLGFDVAVVDVHRDRAQLVRGEDRLHESVAVHAVDAHVVAGSDSLRGQMVRQPVGPFLELGVRAGLVGDDQRDPIGDGVDDVFGEISDVPGHGP